MRKRVCVRVLGVALRNSKGKVALIPHGANGPLRWRELENYRVLMPAGKTADDHVEFLIKMPTR
jgi:hypothetical protein